MEALLTIIICIFLFSFCSANFFGPGCLPTRVNYRLVYPCEQNDSEEDERMESILTGKPTRLARTGIYDRMFRDANTIQWQGKFAYYPTYGYNPNLPAGVYRYSNFFDKPALD